MQSRRFESVRQRAHRALSAYGRRVTQHVSMASLLGVALVVTLSLAWFVGAFLPAPAEITRSPQLERDMQELGWVALPGDTARSLERLGVQALRASHPFELRFSPRSLSCNQVSDSRARQSLQLVERVLARYRPSFVRAIGLRRVLLCDGLREAGQPVPSMPNVAHSLLLDAELSAEFAERLLHHEVFHFADFADDNTLKTDAAWSALNEPASSYGLGGRHAREASSSRWSEERAGVVSGYAMSGIEEDKAEVFSFLMSEPRRMRQRLATDRALARKVAYLRQQLSRFEGSPLELPRE